MIFRILDIFWKFYLNRKKRKTKSWRWAGIWPAAFSLMGQRPTLPVGLNGRADWSGWPGPAAIAADAGPRRGVAQCALPRQWPRTGPTWRCADR
jgi:hypothetical protein